jgi:hypothetical protein
MAIMNLQDHEIRSIFICETRSTDLRCYSDPLLRSGW